MDYRAATVKAHEIIAGLDGEFYPSVVIADALMQGYAAGREEPLELGPDERIVSAQTWEAFQCWLNDQRPERVDRMLNMSLEYVKGYCRERELEILTAHAMRELMADKARMDFMASLADGRIYSATFSRANICLSLRDMENRGRFRECVDVAIKDASK